MGGLNLLWTALLAPFCVLGAGGALEPIVVVEPSGGPRVVYRAMAEPPLVALRLSVPVEEPPGWRGAARTLQELARSALEAEARRIGARLELGYEAGHATYEVVGPRESYEAMVVLLRRAVARPAPTQGGLLEAARLRVEREVLAALEIPARRVRVALESALFSGSAHSIDAILPDRPGVAELEWFWRRNYIPERMAVVVVGAVPLETALPELRDWPAPPPAGTAPGAMAAGGRQAPPPEAVAAWAAIGWSAADEEPAVLAVAAALVRARLGESGLRRATAELWWGPDRLGLIATGSALPGSGSDGPPAQRLRLAVADAADRATPDAVATARRSIANGLLLEARTPQGLAGVVGRFLDRTGDPHGASEFLDALVRVDADRVRGALLAILDRSPAVAEVGP